MKKLFICGIGSLLGSKLIDILKTKYELCGSYNLRNPCFNFVDSYQLDVNNYEQLQKIIFELKPDIIINTVALNNVDYCENHVCDANNVNYKAVSVLSDISNKLGNKLVHLSTDSVFDGQKETPYKEIDVPNPINNYGKSKLAGEKSVLAFKNNLVIRASVLYGWLPKQLVNTKTSSLKQYNFAQWLITQLIENKDVKIVNDEYSTPIIAEDLARSILHLVENDFSGLFHSAPVETINRYDFSVKLANFLNLDISLISPTTIKNLGRNVPTSKNKCLDSKKIRNTNFKFLSFEKSFEILRDQIDV